MQELTEPHHRNTLCKPSRAFFSQIRHPAEHVVVVRRPLDLPLQNRVAVALDAGVHEKHVVLQFRQPRGSQRDLSDSEFIVTSKPDQTCAAVSGDDLILITPRFLKDISFKVNRFPGEYLRRAEPSLKGIKRLEHGDDKAGG